MSNYQIEKLDHRHTSGWLQHEIVIRKINEIIDALTPVTPRILICPHCGSEEWADWSTSTLMGGPMNYSIYMCAQCKKKTKVKRYTRGRDHKVYLGPEDEITEE